jgi:hypothetical protein
MTGTSVDIGNDNVHCWHENTVQVLLYPFYLQLILECMNKNFNVCYYESLELYMIELSVKQITVSHALPKFRSGGDSSLLEATRIPGAPLLQISLRL